MNYSGPTDHSILKLKISKTQNSKSENLCFKFKNLNFCIAKFKIQHLGFFVSMPVFLISNLKFKVFYYIFLRAYTLYIILTFKNMILLVKNVFVFEVDTASFLVVCIKLNLWLYFCLFSINSLHTECIFFKISFIDGLFKKINVNVKKMLIFKVWLMFLKINIYLISKFFSCKTH